jgi:hypothetical protein
MKNILVHLLFLILVLSACGDRGPAGSAEPAACSGDSCGTTLLGTSNQENYGSPNKIGIWDVPKDEVDITFAVIGDVHLDVNSCYDNAGNNNSTKMKNNRNVVDDINIDCKNDGCTFVAFVGDLMDNGSSDHNLQQIVAFRQLYENDYPGDGGGSIANCSDNKYTAYSKGSWIRYPLFPSVGNHDLPPWSKSPKNWNKVAEYIRDRVIGAPKLTSSYGNSSYVWRQGAYYCIQLGLWAGGFESEDETLTDEAKLQWLKDFLAARVGDSGMGILLFQHYGWDGFSADSRWWSEEQRNKELNILCRRDSADQPCNPYNVVGIFSGHTHARLDVSVDAGVDANGAPVTFNNYVVTSAGTDDQPGYSMVYVRGSENKIAVSSKNIASEVWSTTKRALIMPERSPNSFRYLLGRKLGTDGNVKSGWSSLTARPYSDSIPAGGGAASAAIDADPRPDVVLMGIENLKEDNKFYYQIGFNLSGDGDVHASSWSPVIWGPSTGGWTTAGGGAAVTDIDGNGRPELIFMAIDDPEGENHFRYVVGWNLDASGHAASWSGVKSCPVDMGVYSAGGGAAVADIDGNGRPELIFMAIDNPEGANHFRYVVGWNLDAQGNPTEWSEKTECPVGIGDSSAGGGLDIADIDGNGSPDLIFMAVDNPEGENRFRYVVGWNMNKNGKLSNWSELRENPTGIGHEDNGGGAIVADLDGDGNLDLLFMGMDNPN